MGSDSIREDTETRCAVYEATVAEGMPPTIARLEALLQRSTTAVRESLERLALAKALVLQAESREILMAEPFSAVPTPFAGDRRGAALFRQLHLGRARDRRNVEVRCANSNVVRMLLRGHAPFRGGGRAEGAAWCHSLCNSGESVVGRYRLHLKDDAPLSVGRAR